MNSYKGIRGGNPAMRPEKVMLTYSCPTCGKPTNALVDAGRRGKHECDSCRKLRNQQQQGIFKHDEKCRGCGTTKNVTYAPEAFNVEVYGEYANVSLCKQCRDEYVMDI